MSEEIVVKVNSYGNDRPLSLVFTDPTSGKKKAKSSGTRDWREAERLAGELEKELQAGRYAAPSKVTWGQFIERYTTEKLSSLRPKSRKSALESLGKIKALFSPDRLVKVNAALLSRLQSELRKAGAKETTIAHHLRHVKAALNWATRMGMINQAPKVEMPRLKGQTMMRGRPITTEEYERLLTAAPRVRPVDSPAWERFITGLWLSGLRLAEGLVLSWEPDASFSVDLSGRRPAFRIYSEAQKSGKDELLPMTPDFAEWLLSTTPQADRQGSVFPMIDRRTNQPIAPHHVGRVVGRIGKKANVVTNKQEGKFAGCHDLRRSFGTRWAKRVMPAVLRRLMRHASIQTTMGYYVDIDASDVADDLWVRFSATAGNNADSGNTSGNNSDSAFPAAEDNADAKPYGGTL